MRWTLPNILTVLRLAAAPLVPLMFLFLSRPFADFAALVLFLVAAITDWFDGYLARLWGQESRFGAAMDPIADKAMVIIAVVVITGYSGMNPWLILPSTIILFREVFVSRACANFWADQTPAAEGHQAGQVEDHRPDGRHRRAVSGHRAEILRGRPPAAGRRNQRLPWSDSWSDLATQLGWC
jgi:cardiolipin synthase